MDSLAQFKENQKKAWSTFAPTELYTCQPAARLVVFADIKGGQRVLDVACGTGVVALAAARTGARVSGLDLTPELIARARENASIAGTEIDWHEGDAEALPFGDATFDVVVSQFGHMFAPRPEVATSEMLRVLKPGGTIAFSTWPPELYVGQLFGLVGRYLPPPPGVAPPSKWGIPIPCASASATPSPICGSIAARCARRTTACRTFARSWSSTSDRSCASCRRSRTSPRSSPRSVASSTRSPRFTSSQPRTCCGRTT
jgi:SAM-dependent methyltransferase